MLKNYTTVALRHLLRHKFFSAINILCLSIGITFSLLIGVYVINQYEVNGAIKNVERQYVVKSKWKIKDMGLDITTYGPLPKAMREEYPGLVARYYRYNPVTNVVSAADKFFKEDISIGDTSFISMYGFPLLEGNRQKPFADNNSAVITETMARKLFGSETAINKLISIQTTVNGEKQHYKVTAVLKDIPFNSVTHLINSTYNVFVPTEGNRYYAGGDPSQYWNSAYEIGMVELQPGVSPGALAEPLKKLLAKYVSDAVRPNLTVELAPVKSYYLQDNNGAAQKMIFILSVTAVLILLMAVINFVNINIGTSSYRLKEIGLRKVFGGLKRQLVIQFIIEAIILAVIAAIISLGLYQLIRPVFSQVLNTTFESFFQFGGNTLLFLLALVIVTGFVSGIYPAFVLSSSDIITSVKGKFDAAKGGLMLRKVILVVQFSLAIIVFISAVTVTRQVSYVFSKDKGYDKEQLLVITAFPKQWDSVGMQRMINIKNGLLQVPAVKTASLSFEIPDRKPPSSIDMQLVNGDAKTVVISSHGADENYAETFGLKMLAGTCFSQSGGCIPNQVVLNESAAKALGLSVSSAVNRQIRIPSSGTILTIAGIVRDFNYSSLQAQIEPLAFFHVRDATAYRYLSLKLKPGNISESLTMIRNEWRKLSPGSPFEYTFMDEKFRSLYQAELQLKKAGSIATILNLVILFLGIFGIVSFTLVKRTKEIAVRKILGAGIRRIIFLFIKDYAWLIAIANLIAWPVAYILTNNWLNSYAYRIDQNLLPYVSVGLSVFLIAFTLIGVQCFKAGRVNPVKSLRAE